MMAGYGRAAFSGATSGIGQMLGSLMNGDRAQQAGFDAESTAQTKMGQALALIQQAQATARLHDAQAGEVAAKTDVLNRRPGIADEVIAASSGVDVPTLNAYRTTQRTGQAPQVPMGPPDEGGGMGVGAAKFGAATSSRIGQQLARLLPILSGGGDINPDSYAKALNEYRGADLGDQVLSGQLTAGDVGRAQAAVAGKPLTAAHEFGVADLFGTGVDVSNPAAQRFAAFRVAGTAKEKAQAGQAGAAAAHSNAGTEKIKLETAQLRDGPKGVLVQTDAGPVFSDPRTGTSIPVTLDGKPAGARLKDIPPAVGAKIIEGRQALSNIDNAIAAVQKNPDAFGMLNALPGVERMRQGDTQGVDARAQVANIGSLKLHDRSGAAVSASEFPRLAPFIPSSSDSPGAIVTKLQQMKAIAEGELGLFSDFYAPEQGYKQIPLKPSAKPAPPATPTGATAPFTDVEKERRYQVWKANQEAKK